MRKIALTYGIISGTIVILTMMLGLLASESGSFFSGEVFGYLTMLIALSMIFFGIKRYRDQELGGVIKFLPALGLGVAIAAIAGVMYVFIWEMYLLSTDYAFIHDYTAGIIEKARADGTSGPALDKIIAEMDEMKANYAKPWFRLPITFSEIFPVGLLISLISATLLRNPNILPTGSQSKQGDNS